MTKKQLLKKLSKLSNKTLKYSLNQGKIFDKYNRPTGPKKHRLIYLIDVIKSHIKDE